MSPCIISVDLFLCLLLPAVLDSEAPNWLSDTSPSSTDAMIAAF